MIQYLVIALTCYVVLSNAILPTENESKLFKLYKKVFHRVYPNPNYEKQAYYNFLNNMVAMDDLNANRKNGTLPYVMSKYADLNPEEINEHYAVTVKPYVIGEPEPDNVPKDNINKIKDTFHLNKTKNIPRDREEGQFIEDIGLYDLDDVDHLYKHWMKKWNKQNTTDKYDRQTRYYRFIKTVAETNRQKIAGEQVTLGPNADVLVAPEEFYFDYGYA